MSIKDVVSAAHAAADAAKAVYDKSVADLQALEAKAVQVQPHLDALANIESTLTNLAASLDVNSSQVFNGVKDNLLALVSQVRGYLDQA